MLPKHAKKFWDCLDGKVAHIRPKLYVNASMSCTAFQIWKFFFFQPYFTNTTKFISQNVWVRCGFGAIFPTFDTNLRRRGASQENSNLLSQIENPAVADFDERMLYELLERFYDYTYFQKIMSGVLSDILDKLHLWNVYINQFGVEIKVQFSNKTKYNDGQTLSLLCAFTETVCRYKEGVGVVCTTIATGHSLERTEEDDWRAISQGRPLDWSSFRQRPSPVLVALKAGQPGLLSALLQAGVMSKRALHQVRDVCTQGAFRDACCACVRIVCAAAANPHSLTHLARESVWSNVIGPEAGRAARVDRLDVPDDVKGILRFNDVLVYGPDGPVNDEILLKDPVVYNDPRR